MILIVDIHLQRVSFTETTTQTLFFEFEVFEESVIHVLCRHCCKKRNEYNLMGPNDNTNEMVRGRSFFSSGYPPQSGGLTGVGTNFLLDLSSIDL